ncbi:MULTISPECIES: hypothetical protein [Comamonas]|uniref:hypothetical protein n=1 Tax=Comamonas TaxID=283 RepID=UPI0001DA6B91|nr:MULTISPECIES: hypothetical protein [Comamonas]EFI63724.1 hypothetical protein CTS44_00439 [Comamonas thiooxydans]TFF59285.1 hypothetical protein EIC84_15840 [Comamonas sp. A23]
MLTPNQLLQAQRPATAVALLAEMQFTTGAMRLSTWEGSLQALDHDWAYLPGVMGISGVQQAENIEYPAIDVSLALPDSSILTLAVGSEKTYRGRLFRLYMAIMDDELRLVDDPQLLYVGVMDQVQMSTGDGGEDKGALTMRCEQPGKDSRNAMSQRLTNQQQSKRYPGDTGLSRMAELAGGPQTWLTKKFQQV